MQDNNSINKTKHHHHHRHHHRRKFWRIFGVVIAVVLVGILLVVGYAYRNIQNAANNAYNPVSLKNQDNGSLSSVLKNKKPISLLLLGTDTGEFGRTYKGRTDTMMIMVLDPQKNKTTIESIPRDMKVTLPDYPDYSPAKINSAYTYGGIEEVDKTINEYFKVPINAYVLVNMKGLVKAIDKVGGVDVVSPLSFDYEGYSFKKGVKYHMNGKKALQFGRMRYDDPKGDYGRQERQRLVIMALLKKSANVQSVLNKDFLDSVSHSMQTNLSFNDMTTLAANYRKATDSISSGYVKGTNDNEEGVSYQNVSVNERQRVSDKLRKALGLNEVTVK
ncbi:LCP family protein [uncultured Lactobacillus sp.]|uniref:LCP family protein n=1 Tax=uncultured Lactobacillus sp. TaxID=153152 RepID=UPI00261A1065|nr:LCP family protein [uncultured Lactobacillus sp.]